MSLSLTQNSSSNSWDWNWFQTPLQYAKGVGPYLAKLFSNLGIATYEELLTHLPHRYLDRRKVEAMGALQSGRGCCVLGEVYAAGVVSLGKGNRKVFEVILTDGTGYVSAKWFHFSQQSFSKRFAKGEKFIFFGDVSLYRREKSMIHPEVMPVRDLEEAQDANFLKVVPVYPSTEGLHQKKLRQIIAGLLPSLAKQGDPLPQSLRDRYGLVPWAEALMQIHRPEGAEAEEILSELRSPFHRRLIFDEFLLLELGLALKRRHYVHQQGFQHEARFRLREKLLQALPFTLTDSQKKVLEQITRQMCLPSPMNALLQGDVGSGKTIVAMLLALLAIENERQVVVMVPTEILAEQHFQNFQKWLGPFGVSVHRLTAATSSASRLESQKEMESGTPGIVIGTHAVLEEKIQFPRLSLVLIDEQHRFGVRQRMTLIQKGICPDVLVMTATPIPRSLALTLYGDLDLMLMTDLPGGRQPIVTRKMFEASRPKLHEFVSKHLNAGRQVYWVFPLIEESEKLDLKDATRAFEQLKKNFAPFTVAMLHGKMKPAEKDEVMRAFSAGKIQVLVATTVIEVGIDVPNATIMVVEHAERFGLSQLHQLRGRVGRGSEKSYCILATPGRGSDVARERLDVMERHHDGFKIAEADLKMRGPGDFLGIRQSGVPDLRIANLVTDLDILEMAREAADLLLRDDPNLAAPEHQNLRQMLLHRWQSRLSLAKVG